MFRNKKEHDEIVREMDLEKKCHPCTFLEHAGIVMETLKSLYIDVPFSREFISVCASNVINNHVWGNVITFDNEKIEPPFQCPPVLGSPNHDSGSMSSIKTMPMSLLVHFSLDIPVLACESYAFHQENIQYTDVIRNPYQKNPIASIMVTLAGNSSIQNQAHRIFMGHHVWCQNF